jgi:flagellar hook-length control protein FliK
MNSKDEGPQIAFASPASAVPGPQAAPVVIQSLRVLERMGRSEIRVGLNSSGFGNIELHARVNQDQVGASIATSHTELHAAMMAEMPSLEHAIAQHQLKLDSFNLDSRTGAQPNDSGAAAGNQSGTSRSWTQSGPEISEFNDDVAAQETSLPQAWTALHSSGLSVHA